MKTKEKNPNREQFHGLNREAWLTKLTEKLAVDFAKAGKPLPPKIRLTCGWPSKGAFSAKSRTIGECWPSNASQDGSVEVFISPCVSNSVEVGAILVHELVHASGQKGHRASFKQVAERLGLEGKMTATKAGLELTERLNGLVKELGEYPHALLDKSQSPHKKDGTRLLKASCAGCEYTIRLTKKWADVGVPECPTCLVTMELEIKEKEGDDAE